MKFHIDNNIFNFKNFLINLFIFFFVVIVFLNQIHLHLNSSKFKKIENGNFYSKVENFDFKVNYSKFFLRVIFLIILNETVNSQEVW